MAHDQRIGPAAAEDRHRYTAKEDPFHEAVPPRTDNDQGNASFLGCFDDCSGGVR